MKFAVVMGRVIVKFRVVMGRSIDITFHQVYFIIFSNYSTSPTDVHVLD